MKQFRLLLIILTLLAVGSMNTWAETITLSSFTATSASMDANISYLTAQGGGTAAPKIADNTIYLYQNSNGTGGGTITIKAAEGCTIQSVTIGSSMATKVAYTLDASTTKSTTTSVTANGRFTASDLSASSITFYCMGTNKGSRLYVNYLSVTYSSSKTNVSVNQILTGVKEKEGNPTTVEKAAEEVTFYYEAETGYELPDATGVSVKIGTTILTENDDYMWTKETGKLWIVSLYNAFSDDINITITGVKKAAQKLTLKWSENGKTTTTQIDEGSAIGTLPTDPSAPSGCSDKVFVGWSTTNIGDVPTDNAPAFISETTIPASNATYYAVFASKSGSGAGGWNLVTSDNDLVAGEIYTIGSSSTANNGKVLGYQDTNNRKAVDWSDTNLAKLTLGGAKDAWTLHDGTGYLYAASSSKNNLKVQTTNDNNGKWSITFGDNAATIKAQGDNVRNLLRYNSSNSIFSCYSSGQSLVYLFHYSTGTTYTDYITECVDCTVPAEALALALSQETANLGQDGNAVVTFSTTGGNGIAVTYAVTPTTGATLNGTTVTFTQEGTYTLTASQTYTTTNGTTYCGGTDSKKIVITKTPTLYFTTTPADQIEFGTVECGGNTPLTDKQTISLRGYNLTGDVTVTVTGDYKIAGTESTALADYATSLTLPKDAVSGSPTSVYVVSTPPMQSSSPTTGKVIFTTAGGNTLEVNLSTSDITCTEYTLTLNDRGTTSSAGNYLAGASVPKPADPTGVCTDPINYIFDGWATAEVAEGSTAYTKVSFPYTMPAANTTLYAVYKYTDGNSAGTGASLVSADDIVDGGKYYITATKSDGTNYMLEAGAFEAGNSGNNTAIFDIEGATEDKAWTFVKTTNGWYIQSGTNTLGTTNDNNGLLSALNNTDVWTITATTGTYSKLTSSTKNRILSLYSSTTKPNWRTYTGSNGVQSIQLYSAATYGYTTSPVCGPYVRITSGKELYVTAGNAGGTRSSVQVQDTVKFKAGNLQGNNGNQPKIKIPAADIICNGAATDKVKAVISQTVTDNDDGTYSISGTIVLTYKPVAFDVREDITLQLRAEYNTGNDVMLDAVTLHARSLPEKFVIVAKNTDWYALNADMSGSSSQPANSHVTVDETAATAVAPCNTLYTFDGMPQGGDLRYVRFVGVAGKYLWAASAENVGIQNYAGNTPAAANDSYNWLLTTSDNVTYTFSNPQNNRTLRLNDSKFAMYVSGVQEFRILPVTDTCVFNYAPANFRKKTVKSTSATLAWDAVAGATMYQLSTDGTTWTDVAATSYTLTGLKAATPYTCYLRARHGDGTDICSEVISLSFTTTDCDDVPVDLWVSATANAATIMWSAKAPTATVKIYADEQGTKLVKETPNATTPCKIIGLEQNTDYYYQVLAGGSCASAIAHFKTESNEVSIVEWKKDAVIVDINTEVTDADEVSILVENQHTHGTNNQNIADDLFFSKYYEATGNLKLLGIYNGTKDTLPLTNVKIKIGRTAWGQEVPMNTYGKYKTGYISPDEEIILWHRGTTTLNTCVAEKMDTSIMQEHNNISFSGKASIGLFRADALIDIIGAGTKNLPKEGTIKPSWGDDPGWSGNGYDIENPSTEIELSTNRCLLVRGNKVKSGRNAVLNNTTTFATFTKDEWLGRQVSMYKEDGTDDKGEESSCNGFAYVADFNYNDYYTTYDSIANLEIKGNRNEDGTYTIPIPKLDTMACTNLRLQLKKNGTIQATREEKVPIIIYTTTDTKNSTFFGGKLTDEICKTCDVVVRDNAQLSHIAGGKQQFRDMYVYTGSSLNIPAEQTMSLDKVRMFATNDSVSYAIVNNSNGAAAAISVKEVSHVKRIDGRYWYPFSLPYDCNIADIVQLNGQPLGVYGTDWGIKYYDGQRRQSEGNSTTHYGEVSKYWTMMPEDGQLKAYTGYIIGLFVPAADEPLMKSVNFPPATESAYTENADSKTTPITNWPDNLSAEPRHHGWNFVGSPYISLFGSNSLGEGEGLYNTYVQMGWTDALGKQQDKEHIYVSIPNGGNTNTYTQALASGVTIKPFSAYFVQAIDPTNGQSPLNLTYSKSQRRLPKWAPARTAKTDALILTELDITNGALGDNTGVLVSNVYSAEYEIGDDLTKMYAVAQKPQLYTIDAHNDKMAYQALPDVLAHAIPLGIYVPQAGNYTLSLNRYVSRLEAAEAVYLLHNGAVVANLLLSDYTVAASAKGTISGYSLDIRRAPEVVTDIVPAAGDAPYIIARDGVLAIANLPADAIVQVYDVLGHQLLRADTPATATLQVPVAQIGVYTVVITTANGQQVLKTLLR